MSFPIISGEISNIKTFHCPSNPKITDDNVNIIKQVRKSMHFCIASKEALEMYVSNIFCHRLVVAYLMDGRLCSISL